MNGDRSWLDWFFMLCIITILIIFVVAIRKF